MDIILKNFKEKYDREYLQKQVAGKAIYIWGAYSRSENVCSYLLEAGLGVQGYIETKKELTQYGGLCVVKSLDEIETGEHRNYYVIPLVNGTDEVLNELIAHNVDVYRDVLWVTVEKRIRYTGGYYKDECGNEIIGEKIRTDKCCEIHFKGYGNKIWIGKGSINNDFTIHCSYGSTIQIGKECVIPSTVLMNIENSRFTLGNQVRIGAESVLHVVDSIYEMGARSWMEKRSEIFLFAGTSMKVGEKCSFGSYNFIKGVAGKFEMGKGTGFGDKGHVFVLGTISIGEDCMFSDCVHLVAGNGHIIECDGRVCGKKASQSSIVIGDHVWLGFDVYMQDDVFVDDGCIVGANARLRNMRVDKNSCVVGDGEIVKSNVRWEKDWLME